MKSILKRLLIGNVFFINALAFAQSFSPMVINHYGNFTQMMQKGEAPGHILLQQKQSIPDLYGVGALASLQGEITILNGTVFVSRGNETQGRISNIAPTDKATLLATAVVKNWISIPLPHAMDEKEFRQFVLDAATKNAIPLNSTFPFLVKGNLKEVKWHVVKGLEQSKDAARAHADKIYFEASNIQGVLVGFYANHSLEGVITHGGDPFHVHFIDKNFTHTGHVEDFAVAANAQLFLPNERLNH